MAISPTYNIFGAEPTAVIFKTTGDFDGTAFEDATPAPVKLVPTITPGQSEFPVQPAGLQVNNGVQITARERPIKVLSITGSTGVTPTAAITISGVDISKNVASPFVIPCGSTLKISSTGGSGTKTLVVLGYEIVEGNSAL